MRWVRLSISKVPVLRKDPSSMWFLDISIGYLFEMAFLWGHAYGSKVGYQRNRRWSS